MGIFEVFYQPWPWYIAGPLVGLTVPLLLLLGNKHFGVSENFRTVCAMIPNKVPFLNYNWRAQLWNLVFALGILLGGLLGGVLLANPEPLKVAAATTQDLATMGVAVDGEFVPASLFSWGNLFTLQGFILMVVGGFLIGFGTRYAGGCTSGHAIMGLSELQLPSLVAVIGFFAGGLLMTHLFLPWILSL